MFANTPTIDDIVQKIHASVADLLITPGFVSWLGKTEPKQDDLILVNNSFVYRNVKTVKNDKYLAIHTGNESELKFKITIACGLSFNSDFKHLSRSAKNMPQLAALESVVAEELDGIGALVFILLGQIDDSITVSTPLKHEEFETVVWNPAQHELVVFADSELRIRDTFDEDAVWKAVQDAYKANGEEAPGDLHEQLGEALDRLQDQAKAALVLPSGHASLDGGVTDSIVAMLEGERDLYAHALERCKGSPDSDPPAFNEILRIAYNFASDATTFLNLVVSICDLKPIVLWGTLNEHYKLSEAFRNLPWARSRRKPTLKNYIDIIGDARNSAFHNLFPFRKTLTVQLPESAVQGASLLIFSEYTKKKNNQLIYRDKELVDVLTEFTRARQRQIPPRFWQANLDVMDATIALFQKTSNHLKVLHAARAGKLS